MVFITQISNLYLENKSDVRYTLQETACRYLYLYRHGKGEKSGYQKNSPGTVDHQMAAIILEKHVILLFKDCWGKTLCHVGRLWTHKQKKTTKETLDLA